MSRPPILVVKRALAAWPVAACLGLLWLTDPAWAAPPVPPATRASAAGSAGPPLPAVNFWIELREVEDRVQSEPASGLAARVVSSTRGDVAATEPLAEARLRLANGAQGRIVLQQARARDHIVAAWTTSISSSSSPLRDERVGSEGSLQAGVSLSRAWLASGWQVELSTHWPGGEAPVRVDVSIEHRGVAEAGGSGAATTWVAATVTQVLVPLDQWFTLAPTVRESLPSAATAQAAGATTTRRDAPSAGVLQVRLRLATPVMQRPEVARQPPRQR